MYNSRLGYPINASRALVRKSSNIYRISEFETEVSLLCFTRRDVSYNKIKYIPNGLLSCLKTLTFL